MSSNYDEDDQAYDDLLRENDALLAGLDTARLENEQLRGEVEHLNKMFCIGCGACGTADEYAECCCTPEQLQEIAQLKEDE
jgi:hypothetical protein